MDRPKRPPTVTEKRKAEAAAREARLAEALRANLRRRRAQSAARARAAADETSDPDTEAS